MSTFVLFSICSAILILYIGTRPKRNRPPGPWNIPFYSGIFQIGPDAHVTFHNWAKKYGPLIRTTLKLKETLIIDDIELLREIFSNPAANGRPDDLVFNVMSKGGYGITFVDGDLWSEQRRFVMRTLRDFGFGKTSMEEFIMQEVVEVLDWMKKNQGVPVDMGRRFALATVSSLWTLLAGERHKQDDLILEEILQKTNNALRGATELNGIISLFPMLVKILPKRFLPKWYAYLKDIKAFQDIITDAVDAHFKNPAPKAHPRDLIDVYLTQIDATTDPLSSFYKDAGRKNLEVVIANVYGAANATTASLLTWTVLFFVLFPEAQEKLFGELHSVIGNSRLPSISDRQSLPYTEAFTREVFRCASVVPLSVPHETTQDMKIRGYDIKKGTVLIPNLWSMSNQVGVWGDPQNFRPERFLSTDGKSALKTKDYLTFGCGKRQCAGETLGRDNYFLFLTSMVQRFQFLPDPTNPKPSLEGTYGLLRDPQKFTVLIKEREL